MSSYAHVALAGFVTFPLLAFLMLVPYMVYEYRRYGSIPAWKSFVVFSLVLYAICAYYMVILPLPANREAYVAYAATPNLVPFEFVGQFVEAAAEVGLSPTSPGTWLEFLSSGDVYLTLFNVLLTLPVGFYAHYLFGARWWQATLAGFLTSLFFELTQLSGLYGIYAHPYRLFDVNDLIVNTTGALVGYVVTLPVCRMLPDIDDVNARARERGRSYPSVTRRALALLLDLALVGALNVAARRALVFAEGSLLGATERLATLSAAVTLVFVVVPVLGHGATLGQRVLKMRVVSVDGEDVPWWRVLGRQAMQWWGLFLVPAWLLRLFPGGSIDGIAIGRLRSVVWGMWLAWAAVLVVRALMSRVRRQPFVMLSAWASGTRLMSLPGIEALRARHGGAVEASRPDVTGEDGGVRVKAGEGGATRVRPAGRGEGSSQTMPSGPDGVLHLMRVPERREAGAASPDSYDEGALRPTSVAGGASLGAGGDGRRAAR